MAMIPIVILAAGASQRMGGTDKLMREIDGVPLLTRSVRTAAKTGHPVFVTIPSPAHARYAALRNEPATCFDVPEAKEGIGGSIRGALKRLPPSAAVMIFLADMPDLETNDLLAIFQARKDKPNAKIWRATNKDGRQGHPILFSGSLTPDLLGLFGDSGAKRIVSTNSNDLVLVPIPGDRATCDLDTEEQWRFWEGARHINT